MESPLNSTNKASELCLACGLCCRGVFNNQLCRFKNAAGLREKYYSKKEFKDQDYLPLPCPALNNNTCSIYDQRPVTCKEFTCEVLNSALLQQRTWEECMQIVTSTKTLIDDLYLHIGQEDSSMRIWDHIRQFNKSNPLTSPIPEDLKSIYIKIATLMALYKNFDKDTSFDLGV